MPLTDLPADRAGVSQAPSESVSPQLKVLNSSAVFFAILQSVCTAFVALSGLRLIIGIGAVAAATGALHVVDRIHSDAFRIPMMLMAFLGSVLNLAALQRVWSIRRNAASAWRLRPLSQQQRRSEFIQFAISILTLLLLVAELLAHHSFVHHF